MEWHIDRARVFRYSRILPFRHVKRSRALYRSRVPFLDDAVRQVLHHLRIDPLHWRLRLHFDILPEASRLLRGAAFQVTDAHLAEAMNFEHFLLLQFRDRDLA